MNPQLQCIFPIPILAIIMDFADITTCEALMRTCKICYGLSLKWGFRWSIEHIYNGIFNHTGLYLLHYVTYDADADILYCMCGRDVIYVNSHRQVLRMNYLPEGLRLSMVKDSRNGAIYIGGVAVSVPKTHESFIESTLSTQDLLEGNTQIKSPHGLVIDEAAETMYVSDYVTQVIWSIDLRTNESRRLFGTPYRRGHSNRGWGAFNGPTFLSFHPIKRRIFVLDDHNGAIRQCSLEEGTVGTVYQCGSDDDQKPKTLCVDWKHDLLFFMNSQHALCVLPIGSMNRPASSPRIVKQFPKIKREGVDILNETMPFLIYDHKKDRVMIVDEDNRCVCKIVYEPRNRGV